MGKSSRSAAALLIAALLIAAAPSGGWTRAIALTAKGSHLIGNPAASLRLVEYTRYNCSDCAAYNIQSEGVLNLAYIPSGKIALEVRLLTETPIDLAAAMLASCGDPARFPLNHNALLRSQPKWADLLPHATEAQRRRWSHGDLGTRNRAIAADLKLYDVMFSRGYDRQDLDRCLADEALAQRLKAISARAISAGVTKSPSFSINGNLLSNSHDWAKLRLQLDESLK